MDFVSGVMLLAGRAVGGSNCEALPDMSLFHNLKLKRRKVDSRGSSDGKLKKRQKCQNFVILCTIGCPVFMNILIVLT